MKPKQRIKPRNPYVAAAQFRKAGQHGKTRKAERRIAAMALQRAVGSKSGDTGNHALSGDVRITAEAMTSGGAAVALLQQRCRTSTRHRGRILTSAWQGL